MSAIRYALCAAEGDKPLTCGVYDTRSAAEAALEILRRQRRTATKDDTAYWIAELGPESEGWVRWHQQGN